MNDLTSTVRSVTGWEPTDVEGQLKTAAIESPCRGTARDVAGTQVPAS